MKVERIQYPDGQISAKIIDPSYPEIVERINSYEDLIFVISIAEALTHLGIHNYSLTIPCLFGQRSDRRFKNNQSFDLKIVANLLNSYAFKKVLIFDPHSDVSLALIERSEKIGSEVQVGNAIGSLGVENLILVSPDAGAYKKLFKYAETFNLPLIAANKFRDQDGKITLNISGDVKSKKCLIIDDLCSRGNTFIQLSNKLKELGANKVYLYISHFEGGCEEYKQTINNLLKVIDKVYTTNSFREFDKEDLEKLIVYKII